jgi:acetolactate synthase-1/2/3 large subunit
MNVAEAIAQAVVAEGAKLAAGITGQSVGHIADALSMNPNMTMIYVRQERVAVDICDGYARVSGNPGIVFTDAGPAATNLLGGWVNSWGDSTPVLFFAGHNNRYSSPRRQTKEIPLADVFGPVSKWVAMINDPSQVAEVIRRAYVKLRSGRSGPVVIGVPYDVTSMPIDNFVYAPVSARPRIRSGGDPAAIQSAVDLLANARNPYVYVGAGVLASQASADLKELAELLTLPVATTLNGKSAFPENHALSLGIGGFSRAVYSSLQATITAAKADVVLTIGAGFKQHATTATMPSGCKLIQVDVDADELHKEQVAEIGICGDASVVLRQLIEAARARASKERLAPVKSRIDEYAGLRKRWDEISDSMLHAETTPINPYRVTWELTQALNPDESIVLHDAGSVRGSTCQHYVATKPRSFLGFGVQSAMGWSIGAAIGAKTADPSKTVVSVIGEEAFAETAIDIETAIRSGVAVLLLVKNNRAIPATDAGISPNLAKTRFKGDGVVPSVVAKALGAKSARVEDPAKLREALKNAIAEVKGGSFYVLEVITGRAPGSLHPKWEGANK